MNTKKKMKKPISVFFFCLLIAVVLFCIFKLDKKDNQVVKMTPEKIFFHQEYKKVLDAWTAFKKAENDTIHPYAEYQERLREAGKIPILKVGERIIKVYPNDSTILTFLLDKEKIIVGHHPPAVLIFEKEALCVCGDSMVGACCYLQGTKVPLKEFLKNYPFPFGK